MTDIVARLAVHAVTGDGWTRADCAEAAAEIERLRAALEEIAAMCGDMEGRANIATTALMALRP
jgi:hypothetical protein